MSDPAPAQVTAKPDTPVSQPPSNIGRVKGFIGDLARPFAIYALSLATAQAIWMHSPADIIGASGVIVLGLYGSKTVENALAARSDATVKVAQAQTPTA